MESKTRLTNYSTLNHEKAELVPYEDLLAYAAKELDDLTSAIVARHVSSCGACAAEVERLRFNYVHAH